MTEDREKLHAHQDAIMELNATVGRVLGEKPDIKWTVSHPRADAMCFSSHFRSEVEQWWEDHRKRFPNSRFVVEGYEVRSYEKWPHYVPLPTDCPDASNRLMAHALKELGPVTVTHDGECITVRASAGVNGRGNTLPEALAQALKDATTACAQDESRPRDMALMASRYDVIPFNPRAVGLRELRVELRGRNPEAWAIISEGEVLANDFQWEIEPLPSNRDAEFLQRCRWSTAREAVEFALTYLEKYGVERQIF